MKVFVILQQNKYTDYEFCGVTLTREEAEEKINTIVDEFPVNNDEFYINEYEL
jgi:hypothetical protein